MWSIYHGWSVLFLTNIFLTKAIGPCLGSRGSCDRDGKITCLMNMGNYVYWELSQPDL